MKAEVLSCVAGCDTNCMEKIFLQLYLKYSTSDRNSAGRIMIQTVSIITQKTPALSLFTSPDLFFTVPFLYSDSSRPNVLTSSCSVIWVYFTSRSGDTLYNFTPKMCRGSRHMMPSLRPEINCQLFHAALLWVHGNAQLILCCLTPHLICACPIPSRSHLSLGSSCCDMTSQQLCCHVGVYVTIFGHKASAKGARHLI